MTKMTNPWGAQVREIMREMERDREGEQETKTNLHNTGTQSHTNTHRTAFPRRSQRLSSAYFRLKRPRWGEMPHLCSTRPSLLFLGSGAPSEMLAWCAWLWQVLPSRQRGSATNQTRVVCSSRRRPRTVLGAWSQLGSDHSTNHWSWFNCVTLGEKRSWGKQKWKAWLQWSMKPWTEHLLLHL